MRTITKRFAARLLAPLAAAGLLLACSGSSGPAGTYTIDKDAMKAVMEEEMAGQADAPAGMEGMEGMDEAMAEMMKNMLESMELDLTIVDDGTFTVKGNMMGEVMEESGTWTMEGEKIKMEIEGEDPGYAKVVDGGLSLDTGDGPEFVLKRK